MEINDGWLTPARRVASPNRDARPDGVAVELIVVHGINLPPGEFGGPWVEALFTNALDPHAHPYFGPLAALRVSSHLFIRRDGSITQFVSFDHRAWHAGSSSWRGREGCNDFSIGIELEGCDDFPYADAQYTALAAAVHAIRAAYPRIAPDAVVGHSDIAPGRKTDPGRAFDWGRLGVGPAARLES